MIMKSNEDLLLVGDLSKLSVVTLRIAGIMALPFWVACSVLRKIRISLPSVR